LKENGKIRTREKGKRSFCREIRREESGNAGGRCEGKENGITRRQLEGRRARVEEKGEGEEEQKKRGRERMSKEEKITRKGRKTSVKDKGSKARKGKN
jgi:hypothetical protein